MPLLPILLALGVFLAYLATSSFWAAGLLAVTGILGLFLWLLKRYLPSKAAVGTLIFPEPGASFAQEAPRGIGGEVLIPFGVYKRLRKRILAGGAWILVILLMFLLGLRTLPVPTAVLFVPTFVIICVGVLFAAASITSLVPKGQRLSTLKHLITSDPRAAFATYAPRDKAGALAVGYTTYKRTYRATTLISLILLGLVCISLWREISRARLNADQNFQAALEQFQSVAATLVSGQGDIREELMRLAAQSLEPAAAVDEESLTNRILTQLGQNLPDPPTQIIQETETTIVEKNTIHSLTKEVIKLEDGGTLVFEDEQGTVFATFGGSPKFTINEGGIFNIQGEWQIAGVTVGVTAEEINRTSELDNTSLDDEGARQIGVRAATYTNFSSSRDDLEAALRAIDSALGSAGDTTSSFVTISASDSLDNERILTVGTGLTLTDGGAGSAATLDITADSLDFAQLDDTLDLDAATEINLGASNLSIDLDSTGDFQILDGGNAAHIFADSGAVTFNEVGADADLRIEGDTVTNLFFIDASADAIGVGTASPGAKLEIETGAAAQKGLIIQGAASQSASLLQLLDSSGNPFLDSGDGLASSVFIINQQGADIDFVFGSPQLADDGNINHDNRFFFDRSKAAFRAGSVTSTQWDNANVGQFSAAFGNETIASGNTSSAFGTDTAATDFYSAAFGLSTTSSGWGAAAFGNATTADGNWSSAFGEDITAGGNYSFAVALDDNQSGVTVPANAAAFMGGNVGLGTTSFGTSALNVLALGNATAPSTSITNGVQLYAEDVTASSELKVRDEAGNVTTLSPHNFTLFDPASNDYGGIEIPWAFFSRNDVKGQEINVDMLGAIQAIEAISGHQFVYARDTRTGAPITPALRSAEVTLDDLIKDSASLTILNQRLNALEAADKAGRVSDTDQDKRIKALEEIIKELKERLAGISRGDETENSSDSDVDNSEESHEGEPHQNGPVEHAEQESFDTTPTPTVTPSPKHSPTPIAVSNPTPLTSPTP